MLRKYLEIILRECKIMKVMLSLAKNQKDQPTHEKFEMVKI